MTQKMRLKGMETELRIKDKVYPYVEAGVLYLRVVLLSYDGTPSEFLSVMPQDILYRTQPYTEEMMQEIETAADIANNQATEAFTTRMAERERKNGTIRCDSENSMYHG